MVEADQHQGRSDIEVERLVLRDHAPDSMERLMGLDDLEAYADRVPDVH
jgi:hypothetical protein